MILYWILLSVYQECYANDKILAQCKSVNVCIWLLNATKLLVNIGVWHQSIFLRIALRTDVKSPKSRSTLAQVITCCLMTPSDYLNRCWLLINEIIYNFQLRQISTNIPTCFLGTSTISTSMKFATKISATKYGSNAMHCNLFLMVVYSL